MNGPLRWVFAVLICAALWGAGLGERSVAAQPAGPLEGSFSTGLVLRRVSPADPFRERAAALLLRPEGDAVSMTELTPDGQPTHIIGWTGPDRVVVVQPDTAGSAYLPLAFDGAGVAAPALPGIPADQALAVAPDGRIVAWPRFVQDVAPFTALTVYDADPQGVAQTIPIPGGAALLGAQLAGFVGDSAYFTLRDPADGLLRVDLATGTVDGPADLLAEGAGSEYLLAARVNPAGDALALAGRLQPKNADGLFSLSFTPPWPEGALASPTGIAVGEVQGMTWAHAGAQLAIVAATPGDFSASSLYLVDAALSEATPLDVRAAHGSCALFTPDDQWLLFVSEDGGSLQAVAVADPAAGARSILTDGELLDLCEAQWQPAAVQLPTPVSPTATPAAAQTGALTVGQEVTGTIDDAAFRHEYTLTLDAGQVVSITLLRRGGDLDPFLIVLGPNGAEVARNDDSVALLEDYAFNAQLPALEAATSGAYTIRATRFGEASGPTSGDFVLQVAEGTLVTPVPAFAGEPIAVGEEVTGTLGKDGYAVDYSLTLDAGETVTITLQRTSGDLDSLLILYDAAGRELMRNDDAEITIGDTPFNSQIAAFTAPAAGVYTVRATRYDEATGPSAGNYRLSVALAAEVPAGTPTTGATLTVGSSTRGEITATSFLQEYPIVLDAGQVITVTMERQGGDLDCYLALLGPLGNELAYNDDAPAQVGISAYNSQIVDFRAPSSGTYRIQATRYDQAAGTTTGPYVLRVGPATGTVATGTVAPTPVPQPTTPAASASGVQSAAPLTIGGTATGRISADVYAVDYPLTLTAGQTIMVTLIATSGDLDTQVVIYDPSGSPVAFNDDAPAPVNDNSLNSQIVGYTAPVSGEYTVRASRYQLDEGDSTGGFRIQVEVGTPVTAENGGVIQPGQSVTGELTTTVFAVDYTLTLAAGDVVTITMERLEDTLDPYLSLRNAAGSEVSYNDDAEVQVGDSELNAEIASYRISEGGTYTVRATRYFEEGGTSIGRFTLSVTVGR